MDQLLEVLHTATSKGSIDAILAQLRAENDPFVEAVAREIREPTGRSMQGSASWRKSFWEWLHRPRVVFGLSGALALILVAGLIMWLFGPTVGEPFLAQVHSNGVAIERASELIPAQEGLRLLPGDILRVGTNASATIAFGREHTRIDLTAATELKLEQVSDGKHFELQLGKLAASVARQRPFRPLVIHTAQAEARVLGTRFTLTATTNATRLEVLEGSIRFTPTQGGRAIDVSAGHYAVAAPNYELHAQPLTGSILREYWTNMPDIYNSPLIASNPDFPNHPSGSQYLTKFEGPNNWGQDYGARISGYLHPPQTGLYTFWIAAPSATLFISTDDDPRNKISIATARDVQPYEWRKDRFQQSVPIRLVAGRKYYVEVLQKHGSGPDYLAVAWQGPDRLREVVPGDFLSPLKPPSKEKQP
jgi:hypothetical protein